MTRTQNTSFRRAAILAALIPLAGCSMFAIKPATPAPTTRPTTRPTTTPTTTPTPGGARPTTPTTTSTPPAGRPTTPPTTQPTAPAPTGPPAAQPPAAQPQTRPAGTPPAGAVATPPAAPGAATTTAAPPTAAATTAAAITAATAAVRRDSVRIAAAQTARRKSPVYFTLLFDMHNANVRTADNGFLLPEESGSLISLELALQKARGAGLGIAARSISGDDTQPKYMEVALLMGSRRFALDLGAAQRTGFDSLTFGGGGDFDSTYTFGRAGFRSRANIGNTDFSVQLRGLYYIGIPLGDNALPKDELEGWSGETGLSWTWKRFPLTASLGYRIERFKVFAVEQEVSAFTLGAGLLLGRR